MYSTSMYLYFIKYDLFFFSKTTMEPVEVKFRESRTGTPLRRELLARERSTGKLLSKPTVQHAFAFLWHCGD